MGKKDPQEILPLSFLIELLQHLFPFHFDVAANKLCFHKSLVFFKVAANLRQWQRSVVQSANRFVVTSMETHRYSDRIIQTHSKKQMLTKDACALFPDASSNLVNAVPMPKC